MPVAEHFAIIILLTGGLVSERLPSVSGSHFREWPLSVGGLSSQTFGQSLINALKWNVKFHESVILDHLCLRKLSAALPAIREKKQPFIKVLH